MKTKKYLHWKYHPKDIQRMTLDKLYNNLLKPYLEYDEMIVAMLHPMNQDLLTRAALNMLVSRTN